MPLDAKIKQRDELKKRLLNLAAEMEYVSALIMSVHGKVGEKRSIEMHGAAKIAREWAAAQELTE